MPKNDDNRQVRCSFCGKRQDQVKRLIAGPNVFICDECVELCLHYLDDGAATAREEAYNRGRAQGRDMGDEGGNSAASHLFVGMDLSWILRRRLLLLLCCGAGRGL